MTVGIEVSFQSRNENPNLFWIPQCCHMIRLCLSFQRLIYCFRQLSVVISSKAKMNAFHYSYVIMDTIVSQITSLTIVYSTIYSDADQRNHQSSASLAFVWGIHRGPVNSPHKWPVMRKMFPFDDVIMHWKLRRCHDANFVATGGNHQWRQSWHHDNSPFLYFASLNP